MAHLDERIPKDLNLYKLNFQISEKLVEIRDLIESGELIESYELIRAVSMIELPSAPFSHRYYTTSKIGLLRAPWWR